MTGHWTESLSETTDVAVQSVERFSMTGHWTESLSETTDVAVQSVERFSMTAGPT
eukprot:CAMPEP_0178418258 /NCGR_PEP_ID=MMETSP0689_2-20121128/24995_1 /TAXON_ID=160604 /ORGANISM="Amphidinium massartii, Strain CS-259" /LENGTH=54 /DNA_ID=CAMNT_0020039645 /DNA_START=19 /DNA_END=183 /DNA_ORIENTATION=-